MWSLDHFSQCASVHSCPLNFTFHFVDQSLSLASSFTFLHYLSTTLFPRLNPASPPDFLTVCSLLPDHLWICWAAQAPAQGSTSELPSPQELTIYFNSLYPVVLSWLFIHAKSFSPIPWLLSFIKSLWWEILCKVFENSQADYIYQITLIHLFIDPTKELQDICLLHRNHVDSSQVSHIYACVHCSLLICPYKRLYYSSVVPWILARAFWKTGVTFDPPYVGKDWWSWEL